MSQTPTSTASSTSFEEIFRASLEAYSKKTKEDITSHPLAVKLQSCNSSRAILDLLRAQTKTKSQGGNEKLTKWLDPTVNVLCSFSLILGDAVKQVFPPANAIYTGIGVLLQSVTDVRSSQDALIEIFDRIEHFFKRLEAYIEARPTSAMTDIIVKIMVEVLTILGILTKEIGQGRMKKCLKELIGKDDIKEALERLDKLTEEEARMAAIEILKNTHGTYEKLKDVGERVEDIGKKIQSVNRKVEGLDVEAQGVGDKVQDIDDKVSSANEVAKENKEAVQQLGAEVGNLYLREERLQLEHWISPPNLSANHDVASNAHQDTSLWCTGEGTTFSNWKASGSLLWIHGIPGSGKSVLSSVIIHDLQASSGFVAYFYFDFKDIGKQDSGALLSSLLVQLSNQSGQFCDLLRGLYSEHRNGLEKPNNASLLRCLKGMLTIPTPKPIYIVMDALDECPVTDERRKNIGVPTAREKVLELVKELVKLRLPNLRLCVTSRPEFDICTVLEPLTSHQLSLHDESGQKEDIRAYVTYIVRSDRRMKTWQEEEKDLVVETLSEKAGGMFRWVICQLEVLRRCAPADLLHTLEDLPKSLDETYERILKGINELAWEYAYRLLQCLTVAVRPLRVEEVARAMVVDFSPEKIPEVNADWRWEDQEEIVLSACSSLVDVITDNGSRVIQFSHFSVKEFLISDRIAISMEPKFHIHLEPANATLAQACLCDLLQLGGHSNEDSKSLPLLRYAAEYWVKHAQFANEQLGITDTMYHFLDMDKPHFTAWVRMQGLNDLLRFSADEEPKAVPPPAAPLYFAAESGFCSLAERLVNKHPTHLNTWGGVYGTPLHASVLGGHLELAQFLASRGADLEAYSAIRWTPLHLAAQEGHTDIGKWLLDLRVDVDPRQAKKGFTPLHMATFNGRLDVSHILLEHKAEIGARDRDGCTPLHYASWRGHLDVVRLLVDRGADACVLDDNGNSPLYCAMTSRQLDVARILLDHKADANGRDDSGGTFLHCASAQGHDDVVQFFLELGADVDARDNGGNTPLHLAASNGNLDVTRILLKHNAEVNSRNDEGSTPLHKASDGEPETVQLLLDWNAEVFPCDNSGCTPLHIAAATESIGVAQRILEHIRKNLQEQPQNLMTVQVDSTIGPS